MATTISNIMNVSAGERVKILDVPIQQMPFSSFSISGQQSSEWEIFVDTPNISSTPRVDVTGMTPQDTGGNLRQYDWITARVTAYAEVPGIGYFESPASVSKSRVMVTSPTDTGAILLEWVPQSSMIQGYKIYVGNVPSREKWIHTIEDPTVDNYLITDYDSNYTLGEGIPPDFAFYERLDAGKSMTKSYSQVYIQTRLIVFVTNKGSVEAEMTCAALVG